MKVLFGGPFNLDSLDSVSVLVELRPSTITAAVGLDGEAVLIEVLDNR